MEHVERCDNWAQLLSVTTAAACQVQPLSCRRAFRVTPRRLAGVPDGNTSMRAALSDAESHHVPQPHWTRKKCY